ncbi:MAG: hypothetical protein H7296_13800 [Bacteroidia bacterium]|nr:hypothetical protein [Bacteroidia bacterium]
MKSTYKTIPLILSICLFLSCNDERNLSFKQQASYIKNEQADKSMPNRHFGTSKITKPNFDTHLLFGIWADKTDASSCNFEINADHMLYCDYDGNGERLYTINGDSIFLDNPTLIFKGKILSVTKDSLVIHWQNNKTAERLVRWIE